MHGCHCWWGLQKLPGGFCQCLPRLPPGWRGRRRTGQWWPVLSGHLGLCSARWSPTTTEKETLKGKKRKLPDKWRHINQLSKDIVSPFTRQIHQIISALPRTSGGSVWNPSGCCPCSMSNKACRLRRHRDGWENRVSLISSNTPHRPMPMICTWTYSHKPINPSLICLFRSLKIITASQITMVKSKHKL